MASRSGILCALGIVAVACGPSIALDDGTETTEPEGSSGADGGTGSASDTRPMVTSVGEADATSVGPSDDTGPLPSVCGDGIVGPGESCDDGNEAPFDECNAECRLPGELLWQSEVKGYELTGLAIDADGVYVSANSYELFGGDADLVFLHALDPEGAVRWSFEEPGLTAFDDAIAARIGGGVFVAGAQLFDGGQSSQSYLRAFVSEGALEWSFESDTWPSRPFALSDGGVTMADRLSDGVTSIVRLDADGASAWPEPAQLMGDLRGVVVTPADELILAETRSDAIMSVGPDGAIPWSTAEPEVVRGAIVDGEIELVAGYGAPSLVRYAPSGERLGDREAPTLQIYAVPEAGYVALSDGILTRYDDELETLWDLRAPFDVFRIAVSPTRVAIAGPLPPPDGSAVPIQVAAIAL